MFRIYFVVFILIALFVYAAMHCVVYVNLAVGLQLAQPARKILRIVFLAAVFSLPFAGLLQYWYPSRYLSMVWLGIISLAFSVFLINILVLLIVKTGSIRCYSTICALVITGLMAAYSLYNNARSPKLNEITIPVAKHAAGVGNFTIVQLSDLHLGVDKSPAWLQDIVARVNKLNPDLIVITGDLIDREITRDDEFAAALRQMKTGYGVFAVTGNHEYYAGTDRFCSLTEKAGIKLLWNESRNIGQSICVAGVADPDGKRFGMEGNDLDKALKDCDPSRIVILLSHRPTNFEQAVEKGVDLQLSGHAHAGQIPPMDLIVLLLYRYATGLHKYKNSFIYTSTGTGFWGPPMRLFSRSEITKINFRIIGS